MENNIHEDCGVALVRLLKPLSYYQKKYGSWKWGLGKLYLMMEKEHNRGQEGAGIASVKLNTKPGHEYMFRERAEGANAITEIFNEANRQIKLVMKEEDIDTDAYDELPFAGELYMGHLRYSTTGKSGVKYVHPFLRRNNWKAKNLCICGNFNMTNVEDVFKTLTQQGQCPRIYSDTYITLELMGHRLDREVERNFVEAQKQGLQDTDITDYIDSHVRVENVLKTTMNHFDGGYVMCGITGSGEMFAMRDTHGIRPAFWYKNDEIVAVASERPVLQTTFDLEYDEIHELTPGAALIVRNDGNTTEQQILKEEENYKCSFEHIYFSRGSDRDIYHERKKLGEQLTPKVLKAVDGDMTRNIPCSPSYPIRQRWLITACSTDSRITKGNKTLTTSWPWDTSLLAMSLKQCSTAMSDPRKWPGKTSSCARSSRKARHETTLPLMSTMSLTVPLSHTRTIS